MLLEGQRIGLTFSLGEVIKARLLEASPITGGLIFKYIDDEDGEEYAEKSGGKHILMRRDKSNKKSLIKIKKKLKGKKKCVKK